MAKRKAAPRRAAKPDSRFVSATVTTADVSRGKRSARDQTSAECVARAIQWVEVCAQRNAFNCSAQPCRLYMPARGGGKRREWTRPVKGKARNDYLRCPRRGPGIKAAMYAEQAGDVEEVLSHPILDLMRRPNPWTPGTEFMHSLYYSRWLTGQRYIYIVTGPNGLDSLYLMAPQNTRIVPSRTTFIEGYAYGRDGAIEDFFTPDEVLHAKHAPSLRSPYYGAGPIHAVFGEADVDSAVLEEQLALWRNGARPDYALSVPEGTPQVEVDTLVARLEKDHRGPSKRGKFLITTASTVTPLAFPPKDLEATKAIENLERRIWAAFGVPESEVRMNDANLASSVSGNRQYLRQTVKPAIDAESEAWTETILPLYGIAPGEMWFGHDNPVPSDTEAESRTLVSLAGARILTRNEARAELGYDAVDGGDEFDPPAPIGGLGNAGAKPDGQSDQDGKHGGDRGGVAKAGPKTDRRVSGGAVACGEDHPACAERGRTTKSPDIEARFQAAVQEWLSGLAGKVEIGPDGVPNLEPFAAEFRRLVSPFTRELFAQGIDAGLGALPAGIDTGPIPERAMQAVEAHNLRLAVNVSQNIVDDVKQQVADGLAAGKPIAEVTDEVRTALTEGSQYRAERIARTETSRALNAGTEAGWKEAGIKGKRWSLSPNACPICRALAGKHNAGLELGGVFLRRGDSLALPGGGTFTTNYGDVEGPPGHPNCLCALEPML